MIGEPGFGAAPSAGGPVDIPQLGRVIIQDRVTIGANSCIDRGAYADTVIGEGTKLDNLVQIAHNVRIGRNCLMAAFVGISGSTTIGDGVMFGGQAGVADHLTIGAGARVAAGAGVLGLGGRQEDEHRATLGDRGDRKRSDAGRPGGGRSSARAAELCHKHR